MGNGMRPPREGFESLAEERVRRMAWNSFYSDFLRKGAAFDDVVSVVGDLLEDKVDILEYMKTKGEVDAYVGRADILNHLGLFFSSELKFSEGSEAGDYDNLLKELFFGLSELKDNRPLPEKCFRVPSYLKALGSPIGSYLENGSASRWYS